MSGLHIGQFLAGALCGAVIAGLVGLTVAIHYRNWRQLAMCLTYHHLCENTPGALALLLDELEEWHDHPANRDAVEEIRPVLERASRKPAVSSFDPSHLPGLKSWFDADDALQISLGKVSLTDRATGKQPTYKGEVVYFGVDGDTGEDR